VCVCVCVHTHIHTISIYTNTGGNDIEQAKLKIKRESSNKKNISHETVRERITINLRFTNIGAHDFVSLRVTIS